MKSQVWSWSFFSLERKVDKNSNILWLSPATPDPSPTKESAVARYLITDVLSNTVGSEIPLIKENIKKEFKLFKSNIYKDILYDIYSEFNKNGGFWEFLDKSFLSFCTALYKQSTTKTFSDTDKKVWFYLWLINIFLKEYDGDKDNEGYSYFLSVFSDRYLKNTKLNISDIYLDYNWTYVKDLISDWSKLWLSIWIKSENSLINEIKHSQLNSRYIVTDLIKDDGKNAENNLNKVVYLSYSAFTALETAKWLSNLYEKWLINTDEIAEFYNKNTVSWSILLNAGAVIGDNMELDIFFNENCLFENSINNLPIEWILKFKILNLIRQGKTRKHLENNQLPTPNNVTVKEKVSKVIYTNESIDDVSEDNISQIQSGADIRWKNIVITGTLWRPRADIEKLITDKWWINRGTVNSQTQIVVVADKNTTSSKRQKADKLISQGYPVQILDANEFQTLLINTKNI